MLVDIPKLISAYYVERPTPAFANSGSPSAPPDTADRRLNRAFNENHILAITQAICDYRKEQGIDGPLFLGFDTHALSYPAFVSALEVLAANGVETMISERRSYTPTPAISLAILTYNRGRNSGLADGIVITPSHNPPEDGGFKYNPPNGGPADTDITKVVRSAGQRVPRARDCAGLSAWCTSRPCAATRHTRSITWMPTSGTCASVLYLEAIRAAGLRLGVDPLGGAGVDYWPASPTATTWT